MKVLAWPLRSGNPYIGDLYARMEALDPTLTFQPFEPANAWRRRPDLVHVHWPEAACATPSMAHALAKSALSIGALAIHKARGASIVWTCHNLHSHEQHHPRLEEWFRRAFERLLDGIVHLDVGSIERTIEARPHLAGLPTVVAPHGHLGDLVADPPDRLEARRELGLEPDQTVLAFVGLIRPYKNVPALIRAAADMAAPTVLMVAGNAPDPAVRQDVEAAARATADAGGDVRLDLRWSSDRELATRVRAADAVILPYRNIHNSGAAILALSLDRPVAVPDTGNMAGLARLVGDDWVHMLDGHPTGEALDRVAHWAKRDRTTGPDLSHLDPDRAAQATIDFYHRIHPMAAARATEGP